MKPTRDKSSPVIKRHPFQPVTRLEQVPVAFYEILELATLGKAGEIVPLIESVIQVTQVDPGGLAKLPQMAEQAEALPCPAA